MPGIAKFATLFFLIWASRAAHAGHGEIMNGWEGDEQAPVTSAPPSGKPDSLTVFLPTTKDGVKKSLGATGGADAIRPSSLIQSVAILLYAEPKDRGTWSDDQRWKTLPDKLELLSKRNVPTVRLIRLPSLSLTGIAEAWKLVDNAIRGEKLAVSTVTLVINTLSRVQNGQAEIFTDDGYLPGSRIGAMVTDLSDRRTSALHDLVNPVETVLISNSTGAFDCSTFPAQVAGLTRGMMRNFDGFLNWYGKFFNTDKFTPLPLRAEQWYSSLKHVGTEGNIPSICTPQPIRHVTGEESASFVFPEIVPGL
jgi:hypothetical protein